MRYSTFSYVLLLAAVTPLLLAGCSSSSSSGGGGASVEGGATTEADLANHEDVMKRLHLINHALDDVRPLREDAEETASDMAAEAQTGQTVSENCDESGSIDVTLNEAVAIDGNPFEGVEYDQMSVLFNNCRFREGDLIDTYNGVILLAVDSDENYNFETDQNPSTWYMQWGSNNSPSTFLGDWDDGSSDGGEVLVNIFHRDNAGLAEETGNYSMDLFRTDTEGNLTRLIFLNISGVGAADFYDIEIDGNRRLVSGSLSLGIDKEDAESECGAPGTFNVQVEDPTELSYTAGEDHIPSDGELTMNAGDVEALVTFAGANVTITIDGTAETFDAADFDDVIDSGSNESCFDG